MKYALLLVLFVWLSYFTWEWVYSHEKLVLWFPLVLTEAITVGGIGIYWANRDTKL